MVRGSGSGCRVIVELRLWGIDLGFIGLRTGSKSTESVGLSALGYVLLSSKPQTQTQECQHPRCCAEGHGHLNEDEANDRDPPQTTCITSRSSLGLSYESPQLSRYRLHQMLVSLHSLSGDRSILESSRSSGMATERLFLAKSAILVLL